MVVISRYSVCCEFGRLKAVLLCRPHPYIKNITDPQAVLHAKKIDYAAILKEYEQIVKVYKKFNIKVFFINIPLQYLGDKMALYNIMFTRDIFFMTPRGAIVSRMSSVVRRGEVSHAQRTLQNLGIPVCKIIDGEGTFEGADALWVNKKLVMLAVGNRTNRAGFLQVQKQLGKDDIKCMPVSAPPGVLHLLGALQFIDSDTALAREELIGLEILDFLERAKIKVSLIPDSTEIRKRHALNFVIISPRKIIMPKGCPRTKRLYERLGIKVAAELAVSELVNAGGGLACATGILARRRTNYTFAPPLAGL